MGNLAQIAQKKGFEVFGVDQKFYPPMSDELLHAGIKFQEGYEEKNFIDADFYVIGNSISRGNPLLEVIINKNKKLISAPAWLYQFVLKEKKVIAISGTHGKTTVTSMIAHAFKEGSKDNYGHVIAGVPEEIHSWSLGNGDYFVIESDEYDTAYFDKEPKFFHYRPNILIINNIEFDHSDIYSSVDEIESKFVRLLLQMEKGSTAYINIGAVRKSFKNKVQKLETNCEIEFFDAQGETISQTNANLASKVLLNFFEEGTIKKLLESFKGVKRRFQLLFESKRIILINDFAHHPTAIKETIKLAQKKFIDAEIIPIIEFGSNTMRNGQHDISLKAILENFKSYTINSSEKQQQLFKRFSSVFSENKFDEILDSKGKKIVVLMCGNRDFNGLQIQFLNKLKSLES
jgi:UDP-N-acetylmuramate: L-alanyl-gamma-D-glutamyl-meso-diaminopimelate ligase